MSERERKRRFAGEALTMFAYLALLLFITRLWPLLLAAILGIFAALVRLMFLSPGGVETVTPVPAVETEKKEPTAAGLRAMAFALAEKRVTELLLASYPDVRWVWENAEPKKDIMEGVPVYVVTNRAGGYGRMLVVVRDLQVCDVVPVPGLSGEEPPPADDGHTGGAGGKSRTEPAGPADDAPVNYGLLAFEWVEAHVEELNKRCNEALAQGQHMFAIPEDKLPEKGSWQDICLELERNGLDNAVCRESGIRIILSGGQKAGERG